MSRWVWFSLCIIVGLVMLVCGLQMPVHLRALDESIVERAGRNTTSLTDRGLELVGQGLFRKKKRKSEIRNHFLQFGYCTAVVSAPKMLCSEFLGRTPPSTNRSGRL